MLKVDKNPVFHLVRIGSGTDGASPAPSQDTGCGLELPIPKTGEWFLMAWAMLMRKLRVASSILAVSLMLAGCGAREDGPLYFCNFNTTNEIIAAPLNIPCCMMLALLEPDRMWGDPNHQQYYGGYASASDGGGSAADFWGGIGPYHMGGGYTENGPEGTTFVNPPLFFP